MLDQATSLAPVEHNGVQQIGTEAYTSEERARQPINYNKYWYEPCQSRPAPQPCVVSKCLLGALQPVMSLM